MEYIEKKIEELRKISKIKNIRIKIIQNEYKAKRATVILIIKRKTPKRPKAETKRYKVKKEEKQQKQQKVEKQAKQKKEQKEQKQKKEKIEKEKQQEQKSIKKEDYENKETEKKKENAVRKYGAYKDGGKFVPYQEKKKGKVRRWKDKLEKLNKNQ